MSSLKDPFKNTPVQDPEAEYNALKEKFCHRLKNMEIFQKLRLKKKKEKKDDTTKQVTTTRTTAKPTIASETADKTEA